MTDFKEFFNTLFLFKTQNTTIYYFIIFVLMFAFNYLIVKRLKTQSKDPKPLDFIFLSSLLLLVINEPIIFVITLLMSPLLFFKDIKQFFFKNVLQEEIDNYLKQRNLINKRENYNFLDILFLYNLICLEDYIDLFENHFDKTEEEMLKILETRVILDNDKRKKARIFYNEYRKNGVLVDRKNVNKENND